MSRLVVTSENDPKLESWSAPFHFFTDDVRVNQITKLSKELKPFEFIVAEFDNDLIVSRNGIHARRAS